MLFDVYVAEANAITRRYEIEREAADDARRVAREVLVAARRDRRAARPWRLALRRLQSNRPRIESVSVNARPTT